MVYVPATTPVIVYAPFSSALAASPTDDPSCLSWTCAPAGLPSSLVLTVPLTVYVGPGGRTVFVSWMFLLVTLPETVKEESVPVSYPVRDTSMVYVPAATPLIVYAPFASALAVFPATGVPCCLSWTYAPAGLPPSLVLTVPVML
jgi:hypothetical protein